MCPSCTTQRGTRVRGTQLPLVFEAAFTSPSHSASTVYRAPPQRCACSLCPDGATRLPITPRSYPGIVASVQECPQPTSQRVWLWVEHSPNLPPLARRTASAHGATCTHAPWTSPTVCHGQAPAREPSRPAHCRMTQPVAAVAQRHRRCEGRLIWTMRMDRHPPQYTSAPPQPAASTPGKLQRRTPCAAACRRACAPEGTGGRRALLCGCRNPVVPLTSVLAVWRRQTPSFKRTHLRGRMTEARIR